MGSSGQQEDSVEKDIAEFFARTSTTRLACDLRAKDLVGGEVQIVPVQGACSYSVYAGSTANFVVQFRFKSLQLPLTIVNLARQVHGSLAPSVRFNGQIGEDEADKEPLYVYVMPRVQGISWLDFILAHGFPEDTPDMCARRLTLVSDVARFFASSWKSPQELDDAQFDHLLRKYEKDLRLLRTALPLRFQPLIQHCLASLPLIMSLPTVLTHKDFGVCNILVDPETCHLVGVIDWAEATVEPFGINLYTLERLMGKFHLHNGPVRYADYELLSQAFWNTLKDEVGGLTDDTLSGIKSAMVLGLLLSRGFTSRLANMPEPVPIADDSSGAYNRLMLDGYLLNPGTRFTEGL